MKKRIFLIITIQYILNFNLSQGHLTHECHQHNLDPPNFHFTDSLSEGDKRLLQEQEWEKIRITFDYSGLDGLSGDLSKYKNFIRKQGELSRKFFEDNLLVKRIHGNNKFPSNVKQCTHHNVTDHDRTIGIPNSDFHVYFTYKNDTNKTYMAWAGACSLDRYTYRPRFAQINWNAASLSIRNNLESDEVSELFLETTLHEITHALGFTNWLFRYWKNPATGRLYNPSDKQPTEKVTSNGKTYTYLTTPRVREMARKHYNCSSLKGMRLENAKGSAGSHWEKTVIENEFMVGIMSLHDAIYSNFTFSLLEDSGWYKPLYKNVDVVDWGKNKGCDFQYSCDAQKYREFVADSTVDFCNFYHNSVAKSPSKTDKFVEDCKVPITSYRTCISSDRRSPIGAQFTGEVFGQNSKCFNSTLRYTNQKWPFPQETYDKYLGFARCLEYACDKAGDIYVTVNGENYYIDRSSNQIEVKPKGKNKNIGGVVNGPEDWHSFCFTYPKPCKNFCSKNGYCMGRTCHCLDNFGGEDCSISCPNGNYVHNNICTNRKQCPPGTQLKEETKECIEIPNPCPGQLVYNEQCVEHCPARTFEDEGNHCSSCPENCLLCIDNNRCKECDFKSYYHEGQCYGKCPKGYFGNESRQCEKCSYGCLECKNQLECTICDYNGVLYTKNDRQVQKSVCVSQCPEGYFKEGRQCVQCMQGCKKCTSYDYCQTCESFNDLMLIDYRFDSQICVPVCPFGSVQIEKQCVICKTSQVFHNQQCISECPLGYYQEEFSCLQCGNLCLTCSSGSQCDTCIQGYYLEQETNICIENIQNNCPLGCQNCQNYDSCDICDLGKVKFINSLNKGECLNKCPEGYKLEENQQQQECKKKELQGTGNKKCGPMKYEYFTNSGWSFCVRNCYRRTPNELGVCV